MGNRILFQVVWRDEFSPVIYSHWDGGAVKDIVKKLQETMADRPQDMQYGAARLVAVICDRSKGDSKGVGIWNTDQRLTAEDSQGDAGCVLIDAENSYGAIFLNQDSSCQ